MLHYFTIFITLFAYNILFSQTSFNYGPTNFDVVKKINVGDQNVSTALGASNISSFKGIVGSPYRNTFFEIVKTEFKRVINLTLIKSSTVRRQQKIRNI